MRTKIKQQGFTLLEIMLVVSIIVIILGVAISKLGNTTGIAKSMRVQADVQAIKTQLQLYESMNGFYPSNRARFAGAGKPAARIPDRLGGTSCLRKCLRILGEATISIATRVKKFRRLRPVFRGTGPSG